MLVESKSSKSKSINFNLDKFKQRALSPGIDVKRELAFYTKTANISKKRDKLGVSFRAESVIKAQI